MRAQATQRSFVDRSLVHHGQAHPEADDPDEPVRHPRSVCALTYRWRQELSLDRQ